MRKTCLQGTALLHIGEYTPTSTVIWHKQCGCNLYPSYCAKQHQKHALAMLLPVTAPCLPNRCISHLDHQQHCTPSVQHQQQSQERGKKNKLLEHCQMSIHFVVVAEKPFRTECNWAGRIHNTYVICLDILAMQCRSCYQTQCCSLYLFWVWGLSCACHYRYISIYKLITTR